MKRQRIWLVCLLLGILLDFLFWNQLPGINFLIYVIACLAAGFFILRAAKILPSNKSLLLLLPILGFSAITFIRLEPMSQFLAFAFTILCMGILAQTYSDGQWLGYTLGKHLANFIFLFQSILAWPITHRSSSEPKAENQSAGQNGKRARLVWPILRGILLAIPILALFASLLSSADAVFAERLEDFLKVFNIDKLPEYLFRLVYILIAAYALVGVFLHASSNRKSKEWLFELRESQPDQKEALLPPFLGFIETAIILGSVIALFVSFVVIQFQYFFAGQANIRIEGFTYAEYARRGFGELVAVAFFSLLLFMGLSLVVKYSTDSKLLAKQRWVFSGLGIGLFLMDGVILTSAFKRLLLYEAAYGFTRARTYPHVFMIWLAVLLAGVVTLDILKKTRYFTTALLLVSLGFAATLVLMNVDGFIARQNIARLRGGEANLDNLDAAYLASLSPDSVPALARLFESEELPNPVRETVGAILLCRWGAKTPLIDQRLTWRSFHLSRWLSDQIRTTLETQLGAYKIKYFKSTSDGVPERITTPSGQEVPCFELED